ncbi:MAG: DNA-3-methyladenine glycosylase [Anditalea sp.]
MTEVNILPQSFYLEGEVLDISKKLLGKIIITDIDNQVTMSRIVETEAYNGSKDKACHAYLHRKTPRTNVMFKEGGRSYVYLCYGLHHLMNIVTNGENEPNAVLIRAVEPILGLKAMALRRNVKGQINLTNGPGKLASALGISRKCNDVILYDSSSPIWIGEEKINEHYEIKQTTRIGVDYAEEDALLPWRFYIKDSHYVSRK